MKVVCALIGHTDRNYADEDRHYAYCIRCGKIFGHPWASDRTNKEAFNKTLAVIRNMTIEEAAKVCDETAQLQSEMAMAEHTDENMERYRKARAWDATVCAAKIRALKK